VINMYKRKKLRQEKHYSKHSFTTRCRKPKEERIQNKLAPNKTARVSKYEVNIMRIVIKIAVSELVWRKMETEICAIKFKFWNEARVGTGAGRDGHVRGQATGMTQTT